MSDQPTESQDHGALQAEFLALLEQDRALHAQLADVAGRMIAHKAQEAVLASLGGAAVEELAEEVVS